MMKTKNISFAAFAFLSALSLSAKEECGQSPNVVMFLIDDLGWNDFGCYGSRFYQTPTIGYRSGPNIFRWRRKP